MAIILSKCHYNCSQLTKYFAYISHLGYSFDVGVNNVIFVYTSIDITLLIIVNQIKSHQMYLSDAILLAILVACELHSSLISSSTFSILVVTLLNRIASFMAPHFSPFLLGESIFYLWMTVSVLIVLNLESFIWFTSWCMIPSLPNHTL